MFFPADKKVRGKIVDEHVENLKQASGEIAQLRPQNLSPLLGSFSLPFIFFQNSRCTEIIRHQILIRVRTTITSFPRSVVVLFSTKARPITAREISL